MQFNDIKFIHGIYNCHTSSKTCISPLESPIPTAFPWKPQICFLSLNLPILDSSFKWTPILCGLLGLASLMFSRFIYLVACISTSFLFMAEYLAAMNFIYKFLFEHLFSISLFLGVEFLDHIEILLNLLRNHKLLSIEATSFFIPTSKVLLHPGQHLLTSFKKRNYSHPIEFEEVSDCSDLHFPNDYVEYLFMYLLTIYMPALEKCLSKFFCTL